MRAGAALVLAGLAADGETIVYDCEHVDRGFADLPATLAALGADVERLDLRRFRRAAVSGGNTCDTGGVHSGTPRYWRAPHSAHEGDCMALDTAEMEEGILEAIEAIRPALQSDGGDIVFNGLDEDGVVHVTLVGACGTCPVSMMTLKARRRADHHGPRPRRHRSRRRRVTPASPSFRAHAAPSPPPSWSNARAAVTGVRSRS